MKFNFLTVIAVSCLIISAASTPKQRPKANILVMYSGSGYYLNASDTYFIARYWEQHLQQKLQSDPSWPFNASFEFYDVQSDPNIVTAYLTKRMQMLPNVTAIIGPEGSLLGNPTAKAAYKYGIPMIFCETTAYSSGGPYGQVLRPSYLGTSFIMNPAALHQYKAVINQYVKSGVKTFAVVALRDPHSLADYNGCYGAADLATTRGITVVGQYYYLLSNTTDDILGIIKNLRDNLRPDAVLWCDLYACSSRVNANVLPLFQQLNYLPKALTLRDCLDNVQLRPLYAAGLYQFVSSGQFYNAKMRGPDYTEASTPYSSVFRPYVPSYYTVNRFITLK